jgi:cell division control protein 45
MLCALREKLFPVPNVYVFNSFSLTEAHQQYNHMDVDLRRILRERLEHLAPQYGLTDLCYNNFRRCFGYKCILSASDVVYSLTSLLEASKEVIQGLGADLELENFGHDLNHFSSDDLFGAVTGFFMAYDALDK